jgi:hypothetical protein
MDQKCARAKGPLNPREKPLLDRYAATAAFSATAGLVFQGSHQPLFGAEDAPDWSAPLIAKAIPASQTKSLPKNEHR